LKKETDPSDLLISSFWLKPDPSTVHIEEIVLATNYEDPT